METTPKSSGRAPHILSGSTLSNWVNVARRYGFVDRANWKKACAITATSALLTPLAWFERLWFARRVNSAEIREPIFIIGHWQSGHSLLHHYLCRDPQAGYVDLIHSIIPSNFLLLRPLIGRLLGKRLPSTRQCDETPLRMLSPQGDDMMMTGLTDLSYYHAYIFPREVEQVFRRTVLFEGVSDREVDRWLKRYRHALQRVAADCRATRLVMRGGYHTGRIPHLLRLFPNARFIHMYRNPYDVYEAEREKWRGLIGYFGLQAPDYSAIDALIPGFYKLLMERYFEDREQIPAGQLVELSYEELMRSPLQSLETIYDELHLSGFVEAKESFERYAGESSVKLAGTDSLPTADVVKLVDKHWKFTVDRWGYQAPKTNQGLAGGARDIASVGMQDVHEN